MRIEMDNENIVKSLLDKRLLDMYVNELKKDLGKDKEVTNIQNTVNNIKNIGAKILKRAIEYTPVDTGKLRESIYTEWIGVGLIIGYREEYATEVHEIAYNRHKIPTRYKFLEDASLEVALEEKIPYRIGISYMPLEVYINIEDRGMDLIIGSVQSADYTIGTEIEEGHEINDNDRVYYEKLEELLR